MVFPGVPSKITEKKMYAEINSFILNTYIVASAGPDAGNRDLQSSLETDPRLKLKHTV